MKLEDYLKLQYPIEIIPDKDGKCYVSIPDLPGCMDEGDTPEEALKNIEKTKRWWLKSAIEDECPIPLPSEEIEHSGRILFRMSKSLHATLSITAKREGVSLNQLIVQLVSFGLGNMQIDRFEEKVKSAVAEIKALRPSVYIWPLTETRESEGRKINLINESEDIYSYGS